MSALEQALRQIEQDRQARQADPAARGVLPTIMLDGQGVPKQSRRGLIIAVVFLSLAFVGTWLMMLGILPFGPQDLSRWGGSLTTGSSVFSRAPKAEPPIQSITDPSVAGAKPEGAVPVAKPSAPPSATTPATTSTTPAALLTPDRNQPVAAAPKPLAPAPVQPTQAPPPSVFPPKPLAAASLPTPASNPVVLATPAPVVKPMVSSTAPVAPKAAPAAPSGGAVAVSNPASKSNDDDAEPVTKPAATPKGPAEPPQLSRTDTDRLTPNSTASSAARAIDGDYQMIERSLSRGDYQAALESVAKLENYIGENWRTRYLTGVALMGLSRWDQAITALSKAQDLNPTHAMSALYLSVSLQERGEHARAIQVLDKALVSQPQSSELWLNLGHSHDALAHKAEAKAAYDRFLELSINRQDLSGQRTWVQNRLQKGK